MRLFGYEITKAQPLTAVAGNNRGWVSLIREPLAGAWQRNQEWSADTVLAHQAVFSCVTLIASDVAKLRPKLVSLDSDGIWSETNSPAFSPVLRKPNRFQNHIQFKEWWIISKLIRGNTFVLKQRDGRGIVTAMYLLDPARVRVLVAADGSVFYQLDEDNLSGIGAVTVPATEIIHDRMNCLFHPLVGVSPIFASGMAANIGLKIQENQADFYGNGSNPSGILTAPGTISDPTARRLKEEWNQNYSGQNSGKVAVLGDNLKFEPMRMTAVDSQMIEHLRWTAETVCSTFHVPTFKVGKDVTYANAQVANLIYYTDCLQYHIESMEAALDDGLGIGDGNPKEGVTYGIELDLDGLLRMDSATQADTLGKGVGAAILTPNEARRRMDLKPVKGGDTPYLQQQNYSLAALNDRDTSDDPFKSSNTAPPAPATPPDKPPADTPPDDGAKELILDLAARIERRAVLIEKAA